MSVIGVVALILVGAGITFYLVSGNRQLLDFTYTYKYAQVSLPSGDVLEGEVESWSDYSDGDQLQVKFKGSGKTVLTHSSQVALFTEKP